MSKRLLTVLVAAATGQWSTRLPAQGWSSNTLSTAPIYHGGFEVVHDDGTHVVAFSAQAQRFTRIAATGAVIVGVGDWCTLVREHAEGWQYIAYSARTDEVVAAPILVDEILFEAVDDDVCIFIGRTQNTTVAYAFSAQTRAWQGAPIGAAFDFWPDDVVISRFVIGLRDQSTSTTFGFSARGGLELDERLAEAVGARPHLAWSSATLTVGAGSSLLGIDDDWALLCVDDELLGISGVCGGAWMATTAPGTVVLKPGTPQHALVHELGSDRWLGFSPIHESWSSVVLPGAVAFPGGGSISVIHDNNRRFAYNDRWNHWTEGPTFAGTLEGVTGGSVHASWLAGGINVRIFNERRNSGMWEGPYMLNAGFTAQATRNLIVFVEPVGANHHVSAYSLQRGDRPAAPLVIGALATPVAADENVAWFTTSSGELHAYGSPSEMHTWFDHPNGSEMNVFDSAIGALPDPESRSSSPVIPTR